MAGGIAVKLIDDGAAMDKEDLKLQNLLDADVPNEGKINSQVDRVLAGTWQAGTRVYVHEC